MLLKIINKHIPDVVPFAPPEPGIAQLFRLVDVLNPHDLLTKAVSLLHDQHLSALPVLEYGVLVGWLTEARVIQVLEEHGEISNLRVADVLLPIPAILTPNDNYQTILAKLHAHDAELLPVIDGSDRYRGVVTRADVLGSRIGLMKPLRLGGMATPLGVYLTTGAVSGGAGLLGLLLTGVVMYLQLWLVQMVVVIISALLYHATRIPLFAQMYQLLTEQSVSVSSSSFLLLSLLTSAIIIIGFAALLRYMPGLSGFHAAEHQTVNAIEAGERLTVDNIAHMSRVHPRCGTNYWGLLSLTYVGIVLLGMILSSKVGQDFLPIIVLLLFVFALLVLIKWRKIGGWIQEHITTRPANQREIESGIIAAQQVMQRYARSTVLTPRPLQRLWNMGLIQVMIGALFTSLLLDLLANPLDYFIKFLVK